MRPILVTGGAGFIGSHFVRAALLEKGWPVVNLDALTYAGDLESIADLEGQPGYRFEHADIGDRERVRELLAAHRPRAIVHLAAETHVDRSIDDPSPFVRTNVLGTFELLEAARAAALGDDFRFVNVSTDEVYGSLESGRFTESSPFSPSSPYSASKAAADQLVHAHFRTYGLPALTVRSSNNYGPRQFPEKLIPLALGNAIEGKPIPIYGDGLNVRDWLFVEDHVGALFAALERGRPGQTYLVGTRAELCNLELIHSLLDALEELAPAGDRGLAVGSYRELVRFVPDRPGHDRRYALDPSKAESELGFAPRVSLAEGLRRTVHWYLTHQDFRRRIAETRYAGERLGLG